MKRFLILISLLFIMMMTACSSSEADEVLDFHNEFVDEMHPKIKKMEELYQALIMADSDEAVNEIADEMIPLTEEVHSFFDSQELEHEVALEYHEIRAKSAILLNESITLEYETIQQIMKDELSEDEIMEAIEEANTMAKEALELDEEAAKKWEEIAKEYNFIEEDE